MNKYVVYCESENYAGCGEYFTVTAKDEDEAAYLAGMWAEVYYYEQEYEQLVEDYGTDYADDVCYATVVEVTLAKDTNDQQPEEWCDFDPGEAQEWHDFDPDC